MVEIAKLTIQSKECTLPTMVGSEGERAIDVTGLREQTGFVTLDPGLANTAGCLSAITFIDGDNGILRYRGYSIEELCEKSNFVEVAYLLIYGKLPSVEQLSKFRSGIGDAALLHHSMHNFFKDYPIQAHPMAVLSSMVCSLSAYHPELLEADPSEADQHQTIVNLLAKVRVIAAFTYRHLSGASFAYPRKDLDYIGNFLHMMFWHPTTGYEIDPVVHRAVDLLFMIHADHEQNCSTSTVRTVGSAKANLFAAISSGICALWGPRHGGANQAVLEMLNEIQRDGGNYQKYIDKAKDSRDPFRLMGFGHRVYKNYDPRAKIIKSVSDDLLERFGTDDGLLEIAKRLEEAALSDSYFIERKLFPNIDFYSGLIYQALGIPTDMFTVMFALGRLPGWMSHWKELHETDGMRISRPRQIYEGPQVRSFVPIEKR
jgi:citrate synthase